MRVAIIGRNRELVEYLRELASSVEAELVDASHFAIVYGKPGEPFCVRGSGDTMSLLATLRVGEQIALNEMMPYGNTIVGEGELEK